MKNNFTWFGPGWSYSCLAMRWGRQIVFFIAVGVVSKFVMFSLTHTVVGFLTPTICCLDALGAGALLAWLSERGSDRQALRQRVCRFSLIAGSILLCVGFYLYNTRPIPSAGAAVVKAPAAEHVKSHVVETGLDLTETFTEVQTIPFAEMLPMALLNMAVALLATALIGAAAEGIRGPLGWVLSFKPVVFIGTISYGIYVWHNFVPWYLAKMRLYNSLMALKGGKALILAGLSILAAYVSWRLVERPIVNLKRYFPYAAGASKLTASTPAPIVPPVAST